jgi:hypothetical protein
MFSPGIWWSGSSLNRWASFCPSLADKLVGCETLEGLEPASEVVGADEVGEMGFELLVAVIVVALDSGSLMVRFMRSTWPLVQGCLTLVRRCSLTQAQLVCSSVSVRLGHSLRVFAMQLSFKHLRVFFVQKTKTARHRERAAFA